MEIQSLAALGWSAFFTAQLDADDLANTRAARLTTIHRNRAEAMAPEGPLSLTLPPTIPMADLAVGDWVLFRDGRITRCLERKSLISRRAAGHRADRQLIAANLDTLAIVTSCNADFNPNRIERYLALARASGTQPIVVLTKADLGHADDFLDKIRQLDRSLPAIALDGRQAGQARELAPWCGPGQTLGLVGSSGVGKSTLANSLTGTQLATQTIREDDAKGRHTTTARHLIRLPQGGWLMDSPGMRELQLVDAAEGISESFADLAELSAQCRFSDCQHQTEPGCAVTAALASGQLDPARLARWQKLDREDRFNSRTVAEAHAQARAFNKRARDAVKAKKARRGGWRDD